MATTQGTTTIRIPDDLALPLRRVAEHHERTLSAELRYVVREYLQDHYGATAVMTLVHTVPELREHVTSELRVRGEEATAEWIERLS